MIFIEYFLEILTELFHSLKIGRCSIKVFQYFFNSSIFYLLFIFKFIQCFLFLANRSQKGNIIPVGVIL